MIYQPDHGTDETRVDALRLWTLELAHPHWLSERQIHIAVKGLIPEKFGKDCLYLQSHPPYFENWAHENIDHGWIKQANSFSYVITDQGIDRVRDIEERFLQLVSEST